LICKVTEGTAHTVTVNSLIESNKQTIDILMYAVPIKVRRSVDSAKETPAYLCY
jgi:hypothetical protein